VEWWKGAVEEGMWGVDLALLGEYISRVGTVDMMGCAKEELGGQLLISGYDVMTCF
jgi:hypothetical protein